jgi:hypothetical protein
MSPSLLYKFYLFPNMLPANKNSFSDRSFSNPDFTGVGESGGFGNTIYQARVDIPKFH